MKRSELIKKLVSEGLSEKTLANFSDKQIVELSKRMLDEAADVMISKKDPLASKKIADAKLQNKSIETYESKKSSPGKKKLSKKQSNKMDTDKDGDIDAKDLKNLRSKKQKSKVCSKCGMKNCKCKDKKHGDLKENSSELKEWIKSLVENNYHSFTSKKEIMGLINEKMDHFTLGPRTAPDIDEPEVLPGIDEPEVNPFGEPDEDPFIDPFEPSTTPDPEPKMRGDELPKSLRSFNFKSML